MVLPSPFLIQVQKQGLERSRDLPKAWQMRLAEVEFQQRKSHGSGSQYY